MLKIRAFICQVSSPALLAIKHYHGYLKLFREGPRLGFEANGLRRMRSCAHFVVHWGIVSVLKPDVESNDVM